MQRQILADILQDAVITIFLFYGQWSMESRTRQTQPMEL
jgi:hypothetical protein